MTKSHTLFLDRLRGASFPVLGHDKACEQYGLHSQKPSLVMEKQYSMYSGDAVTQRYVLLKQDVPALHILKLRNVRWVDRIGLFTEDGYLLHPMYSGIHNPIFLNFDHESSTASLTGHGQKFVEQASTAEFGEPLFFGASPFAHYGHFVLEFLPRLWAIEHLRGVNSLFINNVDFGYEPCLAALDIQAKLVWSQERVVFFDELLVATQPYYIGRYCSDEARGVWRAIGAAYEGKATPLSKPMDRLYLSRRNVLFNRVLEEEAFIEALLKRREFISIRPEESDFLEQLFLFSNASALIAPYGSAIFSALFSGKQLGLFLMTHSDEMLHHLVCFGDNVSVGVFFGEKAAPLNEQYPEIASFNWRIPEKDKLLRGIDAWLASL